MSKYQKIQADALLNLVAIYHIQASWHAISLSLTNNTNIIILAYVRTKTSLFDLKQSAHICWWLLRRDDWFRGRPCGGLKVLKEAHAEGSGGAQEDGQDDEKEEVVRKPRRLQHRFSRRKPVPALVQSAVQLTLTGRSSPVLRSFRLAHRFRVGPTEPGGFTCRHYRECHFGWRTARGSVQPAKVGFSAGSTNLPTDAQLTYASK